MAFGVRGHCGQRVQPVAVRGLGRGSVRVTVQLLKMAGNRVAAPRNMLGIVVTDPAQVSIKTNKVTSFKIGLVFFLMICKTQLSLKTFAKR